MKTTEVGMYVYLSATEMSVTVLWSRMFNGSISFNDSVQWRQGDYNGISHSGIAE